MQEKLAELVGTAVSAAAPADGWHERAVANPTFLLERLGSERTDLQRLRDLEDKAARYHPARHELTINADFRAITDLLAHRRRRFRGVPGADATIEAQVRGWCEQALVELVLAARNADWSAEQLDAPLSPSSFTAALPRQLLHATLHRRLAQKLGPGRSDHAESMADPSTAHRSPARSCRPESASQRRRKSGEQAT